MASLMKIGKALHFLTEAYTHCKTIAATGGGAALVTAALLGPDEMVKPQPERTPLDADPGIILLWCPHCSNGRTIHHCYRKTSTLGTRVQRPGPA